MSKVKVELLKMDGSKIEKEFSFKKRDGRDYHNIFDENGRSVGWAKKVNSTQYELALTAPMLNTRKTFKDRSMKKALIQAVGSLNARKEGRVCIVCNEEFNDVLPLYKGSRACGEHSNPNFILNL